MLRGRSSKLFARLSAPAAFPHRSGGRHGHCIRFMGGMMKLKTRYLSFGVLFAVAVLLPLHAFAQATTASIHGTVSDPNGAVLADAVVTAVNTSTGISNTQKNGQ
jgi:hypothetical protein